MKRFATIAAIAMIATAATAAPEFKFNGDVQIRLREETRMDLDTANDFFKDSKVSEVSTKYMWNLKLGVKVNDNLGLKFRLSNPNGSNLETVYSNGAFVTPTEFQDLDSNTVKVQALSNNQFVAIPQAEIMYKTGIFGLSAGIIEVKNNTALNLARSAEDGGYSKTLNISDDWATWTNNSQTGLKFSFDVHDAVSIVMTGSMAEYKKSTADEAGYVDYRGILDVPVSFGENNKFQVVPTLAVRSGITGAYDERNYNTNGGVDFSGKFSDLFSLKAGAGFGMYRDTTGAKPSGLLLSVKPTFKFGFNKVTVGYSFGRNVDLNDDNAVANLYQFVDVKWAFGLTKGFSIMPRFRTWLNTNSENEADADGVAASVKYRPEIIFTGKF